MMTIPYVPIASIPTMQWPTRTARGPSSAHFHTPGPGVCPLWLPCRGLACVVVWAWGPEAPSLWRALDAAHRLGSKPPELWGEVLPTTLAAQPPGSWRMLHRGGVL